MRYSVDSWTGANNDVRVINGNLGWGYPGSYFDADSGTNVSVNWSDANTASKFRTKVLISDITEGSLSMKPLFQDTT